MRCATPPGEVRSYRSANRSERKPCPRDSDRIAQQHVLGRHGSPSPPNPPPLPFHGTHPARWARRHRRPSTLPEPTPASPADGVATSRIKPLIHRRCIANVSPMYHRPTPSPVPSPARTPILGSKPPSICIRARTSASGATQKVRTDSSSGRHSYPVGGGPHRHDGPDGAALYKHGFEMDDGRAGGWAGNGVRLEPPWYHQAVRRPPTTGRHRD
jgi:hypothetical protein